MKRFVGTLILLGLLFGGIIVGVHVYGIWKLGAQIEREYTLLPHQKYLFLGSSLFGCGIVESREYENKVVWISETSTMNALIRLREFERRGQLTHVRVVAVPFHFGVPQKYTNELLPWGFYQELPVTWRYLSDYPSSGWKLLAYVLSNLRKNLPIAVNHKRPIDRRSISERTEQDRERFYEKLQSVMDSICSPKADERFGNAFLKHIFEIREICKRNQIKLVVIRMPMLPQFSNIIPADVKAAESEMLRRLLAQGIVVHVVDMSLDEADFFDHYHLVDRGARKVTPEVVRFLKGHDI